MSGADERKGHDGGTRFRIPPPPMLWAGHVVIVVLSIPWAVWVVTGSVLLVLEPAAGADPRFWAAGLALVVLSLAFAWYRFRNAAERTVEVDRTGLTLTATGTRWRRERAWHVAWERVQYVSAWSITYNERRTRGRGNQYIQRPALDVYLYFGAGEVPRWVGAVNAEGRTSLPVEPPVARVRIGGPGRVSAGVVTALTRTVGELRPDLFYRGVGTAQHYVAPRAEDTVPEPAPASISHRPPVPAPAPPLHPVWMDVRFPLSRWLLVLAGLTALTALCLLGVSSDLRYPLVGGLSALPLLLLLPGLAYWLYLAPGVVTERGVGVGPEGLRFRQRSLLWARAELDVLFPWDEVKAVVARAVPAQEVVTLNHQVPLRAPGVSDDRGRVVEVYVEPRYGPERSWRALGIHTTQLARGDSRGIADLVAFPATRLRLLHHPGKEAAGASVWRDFVSGGAAPEAVPHWQLRQALHAFRPDLCHGFDDLPDPFTARKDRG